MQNEIPLVEKEDLFAENENVHIHLSNEFKDYVGILHKHKFIEIVYIVSGKAKHVINQNEYDVKKGDISVINPYEAHAFFADTSCGEEFVAYDLMFTPDFIDKTCLESDDFSHLSESFMFYSLFPDEKEFKERFNLVPNCNFELETVFEKIYYEYKNKKDGYINLIRVYTAEIIIKLLRKIQEFKKTKISESQKQLVSSVTEYIENNYSIKINTEEIASKMFFNKNYISKLFKKETGLSINEFVREIRLKEACRQLATTNRNITAIAFDCGFSDIKTFYLTFKKYMGCTPKVYRENATAEKGEK